MPRHALPQPHSLWTRFAAALSLLCVLSALLAPLSMLAQDVQSGRFGGVCSVDAASGGHADDGTAPGARHCELCASAGLALPPSRAAAVPLIATHKTVAQASVSAFGTAVAGLPFSRAPPTL